MRPIHRSLVLAAAAFAVCASAERAIAAYDFVVLADSAGPTQPSSSIVPSIDDDGSVAFVATVAGVQHILVAREAGATSAEDYESLASGRNYRAIGGFVAGRVAYTDQPSAPPFIPSVFRTDVAEPIYTGNDAADAPPPLNVLGQTAIRESSPSRVIATDGEDTEVITEFGFVFGDGSRIDRIGRPSPDIDGVGRVAYFASFSALEDPICDDKILLSGLNPPIELSEGGVLRNDCPFRGLDGLIPIALNDAGSAAFVGDFATASDSVQAVFVDRTVFWEERSPGFEDFSEIRSVALNDAGLVAYVLGGSPGTVLFTGRPPNHDRVLGTGDALCDGTVSSLALQRYGLNDAGEFALNVSLTNGRRLVVRAEPTLLPDDRCITVPVPEPNALLAALGALAALAARSKAIRCDSPGERASRGI